MSDPITELQLENAGADAATLALVVNNAPGGGPVVSRLGNSLTAISDIKGAPPLAGGPVRVALAAALPAHTYNNSAGTITGNSNGAFPSIDGQSLSTGDRFWNWDYTGAGGANVEYGAYSLTNAGSGSTVWVATRTTDANSAAKLGNAFAYIKQGTANAGLCIQCANSAIVLGTTALILVVVSGNSAVGAETARATAAETAIAASVTAVGASISGKAVYDNPQSQPLFTNAIRRRFTNISDVGPNSRGNLSTSSYTVKNQLYANLFNANVWANFGEPAALVGSYTSPGAGNQGLLQGYWISVADLISAGIVPNDVTPPVVSFQQLVDQGSLVNQTSSLIGFDVILRYAGENGTTDINGAFGAATDVLFSNTFAGARYPTAAQTDALWSGLSTGTAVSIGGANGYIRQNTKVPATWNGNALTGIAIYSLGYATAAGASSMQLCCSSVVLGSTITAGKAFLNQGDIPTTTPPENVVRTIDVLSAQRIIVLGDSHGAGIYAPPGKTWICNASANSDWNFENFSESGDIVYDGLFRVRNGSLMYGQSSFKDYRGSYCLICFEINDANYTTFPQFIDGLKKAVEVARAMGFIPVFKSTFNDAWPHGAGAMFQNLADQLGVDFINTHRDGYLFSPATQFTGLWNGGHPGVRANELHTASVDRYFAQQPGPAQSFKIFLKRSGFSVSTLDDLRYNSIKERKTIFKEINVGHQAMITGATYYDRLDQTSSYTTGTIPSDYTSLQNGHAVPYTDYALIEVTFFDTPLEVRLILPDTSSSVYVPSVLAAPFPSTVRYQAFTPTGSPSISVGATYTSSDSFFSGTTFTYVATINGQLMFTPIYPGAQNRSSGTLTKTGGTGDATITYSLSNNGFDANWYSGYQKPGWHWKATTNLNSSGVFLLNANDLRDAMQHRKLRFLIYNTSGGNLTGARVMYRGDGVPANRAPMPSLTPKAKGAELLTQNDFASLTHWSGVAASPATPADSEMPNRPDTGARLVDFIPVDTSTNQPAQAFTWTAVYDDDLLVEVTAIMRNFPTLNNPVGTGSPQITSDTYDDGEVEIDITTNSGNVCPVKVPIGLFWSDRIKFRTRLPQGDSAATITFKGITGTLQIVYASVKAVY